MGDLSQPLITAATDEEEQYNDYQRGVTFDDDGVDLDPYGRVSNFQTQLSSTLEASTSRPYTAERSTFVSTTLNVAKVIMGSGMLVGNL